MQKLIVEPKFNNKKLSIFLYSHFSGLTSATFHKALRKKDIRINDQKVNEDLIVHENDVINVYIVDELLFKKIKKIYEDENILIVNKPQEMEVVSSDSSSLLSILKKDYSYIEACHRIDRNTSGLVLLAKNPEAHEILLSKFERKEIEKHYRCTVLGLFNKKQDLLEAYLFKDNKKSIVYISDEPKKGYIKIQTKYKVISENKADNTSFLDVELLTGKTHQIRAHLAHIGHPIIGDGKYGINEINKKMKVKYQMLENYSIKFTFTENAGMLNYLNNKTYTLKKEL